MGFDTKMALVIRHNKKCVAQWKIDNTGKFVRSEGVYLAQISEKNHWYLVDTPFGKTLNISDSIYKTLPDMILDGWKMLSSPIKINKEEYSG